MDSITLTNLESMIADKVAFNSIEWILYNHGSYSLWKVLSSPLYGFYSIKPPGGDFIYMV
jgi:hypothetical protein